MNIVLISTYNRPALYKQTILSLIENASSRAEHHITVVFNNLNPEHEEPHRLDSKITLGNVGASAARNIGASSIPKYRRQSHVMFLDDDVFMCKGWDAKMIGLAQDIDGHHSGRFDRGAIISGHSHPYNHAELTHIGGWNFGAPLVISSVCMMMPWALWDDVGFFTEPGGSGGSEDYDYCVRAKAKGYGFAVTSPEVVIHTGLHSSNGKEIVGYREVLAHNNDLLKIHGLDGKVIFS